METKLLEMNKLKTINVEVDDRFTLINRPKYQAFRNSLRDSASPLFTFSTIIGVFLGVPERWWRNNK